MTTLHSVAVQELQALLAIRRFDQCYLSERVAEDNQAITGWAEAQLSQDNPGDNLLILASLNFDCPPDEHELACYLDKFLQEQQIAELDDNLAATLWLRRELGFILDTRNRAVLMNLLFRFDDYLLDLSHTRFTRKTRRSLSRLYRYLFDGYDQNYDPKAEADSMSDETLFAHVHQQVAPFCRALKNSDWRTLLAAQKHL
ncbi:hypothetical protein [Pantoea sp. A4]|uniref:hypothetical protein n=1 Tax=Pantoea sp. A4 TaxID=1225184 RepID=UPI00036FDBC4|nr:hypothetical protein [Pantoea sp. A4]